MDITHRSRIEASTSAVFGELTDRSFQQEKARRLDALEFTMDVEERARGARVTTRRKVATRSLPEFVKSLLTPTMVVIEAEDWESAPTGNSPASGAFTVDVDGAPVRLAGRVELTPAEDGQQACDLTFTAVLTATVPLFRAKIEEASSGAILETMRVEAQLLHERFEETRTKAA